MEHIKIVQYGIGMLIIETILMGIWFYSMKPESQIGLNLLQFVFVLFGFNLIFGLLLYFLKKPLFVIFFANTIICPFIFYALWIMWFTYFA